VGEAGEPAQRCNPANEITNIYKYRQVPLAGKRINITLPVEDDVEISLNGLFVIRAVSKFMDKSC